MAGKYKGKSPSDAQRLHDRLDQLAFGRPRRELASDRKKSRSKSKSGGKGRSR